MANLPQSNTRKTILEVVGDMPFVCLNCGEKIERLRRLVRLGCHCTRPFYHIECVDNLPSHANWQSIGNCLRCGRRAHILRGIRAIWDSYSLDEWKNALNPSNITPHLLEMYDSFLLDANDLLSSSVLRDSFFFDYWKISILLEGRKPEERLITERLIDARRNWPAQEMIIIGPKDDNNSNWNCQVKDQKDFLYQLWVRTGAIINECVLEWIAEDPLRNQSIFFSGPLVYDILYGLRDKSNIYEEKKLIVYILSLEDTILKKLLLGFISKLSESASYSYSDSSYSYSDADNNKSFTRAIHFQNKTTNCIRCTVEGISLPIEIQLLKSNDIRRTLLTNNAGRIPYTGSGIIVSPSRIVVNLQWLYTCRERVICIEPAKKAQALDLEAVQEPIHEGFLVGIDLLKLRKDPEEMEYDAQEFFNDLDYDHFIPRGFKRITLKSLGSVFSDENNTNLSETQGEMLEKDSSKLIGNSSTTSNSSEFLSFKSRLDQNLDIEKTFGFKFGDNPNHNSESVSQVVKKVTYNRQTSILADLPNPYLPQK